MQNNKFYFYFGVALLLLGIGQNASAVINEVLAPVCLSVPTNRTLNFNINSALVNKQTLAVVVAGDQPSLDGASAQLGAQSLAKSQAGIKTKANSGSAMAIFSHWLNAGAPSGTGLQIKLKFAAANAKICVTAYALPVLPSGYILRAQDQTRGEATSVIEVSSNYPAINAIAISSFWYRLDPGTLTTTGTASLSNKVCSAPAGPCFVFAKLENANGTITTNTNSSVPTDSAAVMMVLENTALFADGFE